MTPKNPNFVSKSSKNVVFRSFSRKNVEKQRQKCQKRQNRQIRVFGSWSRASLCPLSAKIVPKILFPAVFDANFGFSGV